MITTGKRNIEQIEVLSVTCDKCGVTYTPAATLEWQEVYTISFTGGFGSVFGDGARVRADFCQKCLYTLICRYYHEEVGDERDKV